MPRPLEKTMKPEQVAELLEVSTSTLATWRCDGRGPAYHRLNGNGPVRYNAASVRKFLNACLVTPGERGK